jgi:hypothetical protein
MRPGFWIVAKQTAAGNVAPIKALFERVPQGVLPDLAMVVGHLDRTGEARFSNTVGTGCHLLPTSLTEAIPLTAADRLASASAKVYEIERFRVTAHPPEAQKLALAPAAEFVC